MFTIHWFCYVCPSPPHSSGAISDLALRLLEQRTFPFRRCGRWRSRAGSASKSSYQSRIEDDWGNRVCVRYGSTHQILGCMPGPVTMTLKPSPKTNLTR